jgi:signal transduction histidine kinase
MRLVRRSIPEDRNLSADEPSSPTWALTDPQLLQSSLLNLILNARDATSTGGHITLRSELRELTAEAAVALDLEVGALRGGQRLRRWLRHG